MRSDLFEQAKQDVGKAFPRPEDIGKADDLSLEQKVELLKQWEIDLRLLMVASDENMAGTKPGQVADNNHPTTPPKSSGAYLSDE